METTITNEDVLNLGTWLGRTQAFGLVSRRCSAAEIECLIDLRDKKTYLAVEPSWEDFCQKRLGANRTTVERLIRTYERLGPNLVRLSAYARIKPSEYNLFDPLVSEEGLAHDGQTIPLEPENAPRLAAAVEALRRRFGAELGEPQSPAPISFGKAERYLRAALNEFTRLKSLVLDDADRAKLACALESAHNELQQLRD
jgi:hypothetical protein